MKTSLFLPFLLVVSCEIHAVIGQRWQPKASDGLTWQWQLQGTINQTIDVDVYDVDLFDTPTATIQSLQAKGKKVICYFSAGTYEGWRGDWKKFFKFIKGDSYSGNKPPFAAKMSEWDERWLDIRKIELLKPIMTSRLNLAVEKGCDAVEPDNMDAWSNRKEVKVIITAAEQLTYNRWIAEKAHELGISVAIKNDLGQLKGLVDYFDFAVNEQCFQYKECDKYKVFTNKDKAVFGVEYTGNPSVFCPKANSMKLSWMLKNKDLKVYRKGCEDFL